MMICLVGGPVDEDELLDAGIPSPPRPAYCTTGLSHHRQHLLGHRFGRGQEPRGPCRRQEKDGFFERGRGFAIEGTVVWCGRFHGIEARESRPLAAP